MWRDISVGVVLLAGAAVALPEDRALLDGKWSVSFETDNTCDVAAAGCGRAAELVIDGGHGTWVDFPRGVQRKANPCLGKTFEVAVNYPPNGAVGLHVLGSRFTGCTDYRMRLNIVNASTLEGQLASGRPVKLVRQ